MNNSKFFDPSTKRGRLRSFCLEAIERHRAEGTIPTNVRFIYYEAVSAGIVEKTDPDKKGGRRADQYISEALADLRKAELVDDWEIEDRTRDVIDYTAYSCSLLEAIPHVLEHMRLCPWKEPKPHLIVESESLAGLFDRIAYAYRIPVSPLRGQASRAMIHNDIKPIFDKEFSHVLFLGDCDKAGHDIETSAVERLSECCDIAEWETIALTREQVDEYGLPWIKRTDGRDKITREVCETEAMPQRILMKLVTDRLDELLFVKLSTIERREKKQRREILKKLEGLL